MASPTDKLRFFRGELPDAYSFTFESAIFNTSKHLQLQGKSGRHSFFLLNDTKKQVLAAIHFHVIDKIAASPLRASFGGLELNASIDENIVSDFIEFVVEELRSSGTKKIIVRQPPLVQEDTRVTRSFLGADFKIRMTELDSFLNVSGKFSDRLQDRKSRKLKSLKKRNWIFKSQSRAHLFETYQFILMCRAAKEYSLSMTFEQLEQLAKVFPKNIFLFQVLDEGKIIAASISIKIKDNWLYDFYHDHDADYDASSPILFLMESIYNFCKVNSIQSIELGTSMKGEVVNEGLLIFKRRLGAITVPKITFVKEF